MKNLFKIGLGMLVATAVTVSAAGNYPFPQNKRYPNGKIIEYADTDMIKEHYNLWKQAWYQSGTGWVLAPEGTCSTVSEAIAYGMLITVYMDDEETFKKIYGVWTSNQVSGGKGMNWRIGCGGGTGSASDADFDAALALVMASKQWGGNYLDAAKALISWIASNDINSNKIKPGNQWNDAFNPSYATTANFKLFQEVNGGSWSNVISQTYTELSACQDSKTGLVPDWCDWDSHKPRTTSAAVSNDVGFYDDAARTPWRMAWAYYWYGDSKAQSFNKKVVDWLIPTTRTASGVNSGYKYEGNAYHADNSEERNFVSSTFSGGLGLATSSIDSKDAETYLGTVYKVLKEKKSCATASGCGESVTGEKYYPATLNMLYLLLVTGNMPNLYNMSGFTSFTPDPSKAPSISEIGGIQQEHGDQTVGITGLWNWGAYHDKYGIGTKMVPDSGSSPLFKKEDGSIFAEASMEIGPEPEWTAEAAAAGTLKYPSAGIAVSFKSEECKATKTCGVDFTALGIKYIRVTSKSSGPIRMAILNVYTDENEENKVKNAGAGSEPGIFVANSAEYVSDLYDLTPTGKGFKGVAGGDTIGPLKWVDMDAVPDGSKILKAVKGLKWEVKEAKGGIGEISIMSVEFLDANMKAVDPYLLTGVKVASNLVGSSASVAPRSSESANPGSSSSASSMNAGSSNSANPGNANNNANPGVVAPEAIGNGYLAPLARVSVSGMNISVENVGLNADIAVFTMQGKLVASGKTAFGNASVAVPNKGAYLVRVNGRIYKVNVK
jgi:hypothetical protein